MNKTNEILWAASLLFIGLSSIVLGVSRIADYNLPDMVVRIIGILDIIFICILTFTTVKKLKRKN